MNLWYTFDGLPLHLDSRPRRRADIKAQPAAANYTVDHKNMTKCDARLVKRDHIVHH